MSDELDIKLIALCLRKNRDAQKKMYTILLPYLNVICKRYLVNDSDLKDALQDTFISVFKNLYQFDVERAGFKTWTTRIAINTCLRYNKKNKVNKTEEFIVELHEPGITPEAINNLSNEEIMLWLKKMPQSYFEVFNMYVIDGFSHEEIADMLGIEVTLYRKRLSRARAWVKKRLSMSDEVQFNFSPN